MTEVTFRDFQKVMTKRRRPVDELVDVFYGKLEENRPFFQRVMSSAVEFQKVVIPYKTVLEYYFKERSHLEDLEQSKSSRLAA